MIYLTLFLYKIVFVTHFLYTCVKNCSLKGSFGNPESLLELLFLTVL